MTARPIITGEPASSCSRATVKQSHRNAPSQNALPGRLIAIEGPAGVGKTTITHLVVERLHAGGMPAVATQEPSDRYQHAETIWPALERGNVMVCDGYIATSLALQCMDGVDRDVAWALLQHKIRPDLVIMVGAQPDVLAQRRLVSRGADSRDEREYSRIECAYFAEASRFLRRQGVRVLDVDASHVDTAEVARTAVAAITRRLRAGQGYGRRAAQRSG
ncbi:dTMP kinase [Streptomyces anulatus]|uniref:dTMP kinase n=1 Tax=Streptomyces anulatus TaxID=1892 RepID=UPI00344AC48C